MTKFVIFVLSILVCSGNGIKFKRSAKNVYKIVTFPNDSCMGDDDKIGTCYTELECQQRSGTPQGTCASGYGVCCIVTLGCDGKTFENVTYFDSTALDGDASTFIADICPCASKICQLRLDFETFSILGPATSIDIVALRPQNSGEVGTGQNGLSAKGQCLTDSFSVTNPNGPNPPTICGVNTGEHMYVEASEACNRMIFHLGNSQESRSWSIRVTQYSCTFPNLAPQGCVQYFFGDLTGSVQSYNFDNGNGLHLANQDQSICVRKEANQCRLCWTVDDRADFSVSGTTIIRTAIDTGNLCCAYSDTLGSTSFMGFDCVQIPLAVNDASTPVPVKSRYCGNAGLRGGTVCSTRLPFQLSFRSDKWEVEPEARNRQPGFRLTYFMQDIGCNPTAVI